MTADAGAGPTPLVIVDIDLSAKNDAQLDGHGLPPVWRGLWTRLCQAGREPTFVHLQRGPTLDLVAQLAGRDPALLLLHLDNYLPVGLSDALATLDRATRVLACGYLPTVRPSELLDALPTLAGALRGPLEEVLPALAALLASGADPLEAPNAVVRGRPVASYAAVQGDLGVPDGDGVRAESLRQLSFNGGVGVLQGSMGCPGRCAFCRTSAFHRAFASRPYTVRAVDDVVDEIEHLHRRCGLRHFKFFDANFLGTPVLAPRRAQALAAALRGRGLAITFELHGRSDAISDAVLQALAPVGLRHVAFGVESMSPSQLSRYQKGETVEDHLRATRALAERGLLGQAYTILADPLVTRDELRESLAGLVQINQRALVLIHERMILYRDTPYFAQHGAALRGARPLASSLGTVVDYELSDDWVRGALPVLHEASRAFVSALAARERVQPKAGVALHGWVRRATALRLDLLRRIADDDAPAPTRARAWLDEVIARIDAPAAKESQP